MQPGEEIESLLDELEQVVSEAKTPFTGGMQKKIVDSREIYEIIDEIRSMFPQEFADARRILKEEDETKRAFRLALSEVIARTIAAGHDTLGGSGGSAARPAAGRGDSWSSLPI